MKHQHNECLHSLKHCQKCDEVYCTRCDMTWGRSIWNWSYPYYSGNTTTGSIVLTTGSNIGDAISLAEDTEHKHS